MLLRCSAKRRSDVREVLQSLLGSHLVWIHDAAHPVKLQRGQSGVLGEHGIERLVARPRGGLLLGGVHELGAHLRASGVEENGVSDGGAVLIVDVANLKLRGSLGAGRGPDGDGGDGDDVGIHRRLVVGGLGVDVVDGAADIHLDGAVGRRRRDGGDGAELPVGGSPTGRSGSLDCSIKSRQSRC